jgi:hypothetical protein
MEGVSYHGMKQRPLDALNAMPLLQPRAEASWEVKSAPNTATPSKLMIATIATMNKIC